MLKLLCRHILLLFEVNGSDLLSESEFSECETDNEYESDFQDLNMLPINSLRADVSRSKNYFEDTVPRMDDYFQESFPIK